MTQPVRVVRASVCGSDLHLYQSMPPSSTGVPMGHVFLGVVEEVGADVVTVQEGDFVISPFAYQDNTCVFCRDGFPTSCVSGGWHGADGVGGGRAEAVRVPQADGTLVKPGVPLEDTGYPMFPSLLTPSDVFLTGRWPASHSSPTFAFPGGTVAASGKPSTRSGDDVGC